MELLPEIGAAVGERSNTPSHLAIRNRHTGVVGLLLSNGASIQARNRYSMTPLHFAAGRGHTGVVELLLSKGAPIETA